LFVPAAFTFALLVLPFIGLISRAGGSNALEVLTRPAVREAIWLSAWTTTTTLLLTLALGMPLAYVLARRRFPLRRVVVALAELPIVLPPAVAGLALLVTFGRRGLVGGLLTPLGITLPFTALAVIVVQTFVAVPFFIRSAQVGFQLVPREIEEAARVDGAGGLGLFWRVTLPLAMRSVLVGLAFGWARALGEFGATILFAGNIAGRTQTMPLLVYSELESDAEAATWTSLILIAVALITLLLIQSLSHRAGDEDSDDR
jgi:molybdate transport system permease protein